MIYRIEVERWTGIFSLICYADVYVGEGDAMLYHTANAFTKKKALKRAMRYIERSSHTKENKEIYVYDHTDHVLSRVF